MFSRNKYLVEISETPKHNIKLFNLQVQQKTTYAMSA